jgi:DNA oxidative demethylase
MSLFEPDPSPEREPIELAPGAWFIPNWLTPDEQLALRDDCDRWTAPPAGAVQTVMPNGGVMSVRTVCLGWHWVPYRYQRALPDGAPVKPFPASLVAVGRRAVARATNGDASAYRPDVALVNVYDGAAKMGLHQDKDERSLEPVVSISLGASAVFRFGNTETRTKPWVDVVVRSGDLVVFGGPSRLAYHGVTKVLAGTGPWVAERPDERLNITIRVSGLSSGE